ncbi:MAG: hypothetical protein ACK41D_10490 [Rubricoccaceae bacterium]
MTRSLTSLALAVLLLGGCRPDPPPTPAPDGAPGAAAAGAAAPGAAAPGAAAPGAAAAVAAAPAPGPAEPLVAGLPEPHARARAGEGVCVVYPGLAIRTAPRAGAGETVAAGPPAEGADPCAAVRPLRDAPAEFFAGAVDGLVLLDAGTAPEGRRLRVVEAATGRVLLDTPYAPPVEWGGGRLHFGAAPERAGPAEAGLVASLCPEAAAWQAQGLGVGVSRRMQFDPATRVAAPSPVLACMPLP